MSKPRQDEPAGAHHAAQPEGAEGFLLEAGGAPFRRPLPSPHPRSWPI